MDITEFAIEQTATDGSGRTHLRPIFSDKPTTYVTEDDARDAMSFVSGTRDDSAEYRVVTSTRSPWTPARKLIELPTDVCRCGHTLSQHTASISDYGAVCIVTKDENIGDGGADSYIDDCMNFVPVSAV